jgi:hypothetical protein
MVKCALLALKLARNTQESQKRYLDKLKVSNNSLKKGVFLYFVAQRHSRYFGRGRFWSLSRFKHLYKI